MNPKSKDVITGLVVVVIIIGALLLSRYKSINKTSSTPQNTPTITQKIKNKFPNINIPDDNKIELKDVSGGEAMGIVTETEVLANLPDLPSTEFYQVWSNENGVFKSLGKMRIAKGGYLFEGNLKGKQIVVSREKIFDNKLEVKILE